MGLEVLLHVVGARELFGAPLERAWDRFLGRVDLGMPRCVARRGERLLAPVAIPIAAGEPLHRPLTRTWPRQIVLV